MMYPNQVTTGGVTAGGLGRAGGGFGAGGAGFGGRWCRARADVIRRLGAWTQNAPTFFQWVGGSSTWLVLGLAVAALLIVGMARWRWRRRPLTGRRSSCWLTTSVLAVPFFLPEMHERYFYLADVLTIVVAFYVRRFWPVAVVVSACSLLAYFPAIRNLSKGRPT